jgi:hypothetical protein
MTTLLKGFNPAHGTGCVDPLTNMPAQSPGEPCYSAVRSMQGRLLVDLVDWNP